MSGPLDASRARLALAALVLSFATIVASASVSNSTTFDEILFPAAGLRGFATGDFSLVSDHPRLMQYAYGAPLLLLGLRLPAEDRALAFRERYEYARALLWGSGNPPERIIFAARLVAVLCGSALVAACFFLTRRSLGNATALLAALLVSLLPDVLAHSAISYNDIPIALAVFVAVALADRAARDPRVAPAALAGLATGVAICVKTTALLALPVAALLAGLEAASGRWHDERWRRALPLAIVAFALAAYAAAVVIYLGDFTLADLRETLRANTALNSAGRMAMILGRYSETGFWYFYPLAFTLKTPVALQCLAILALTAGVPALRGGTRRELLAHPLRASAVALALFAMVLMSTRINIGFRHALPALPFACVLVAAGLAAAVKRFGRVALAAVVVLVIADAASALASYPYFLPYVSEYVRGRPINEVLVDSSTDWGQGLVALNRFMHERGTGPVYLGYMGSAVPEGYGIDYVAAPSYFPLRGGVPRAGDPPPRFIAISATALDGIYMTSDPYAAYRSRKPVAVLAGTLFVFEVPR